MYHHVLEKQLVGLFFSGFRTEMFFNSNVNSNFYVTFAGKVRLIKEPSGFEIPCGA
jgi:hypothetical protein